MGGMAVWVLLGVIAWGGLLYLGWGLWNQDPPRAGFDLALLLEGARAVLGGESPYDPAMLAGQAPSSTELFYSYPPPVAQAMTLVAWMPNGVVLVLWGIGATAGLGHIAAEISRREGMGGPSALRAGFKAMMVAPLFLPFAVAILFGNLDAWYPLAYGALLLTILARPSKLTLVAAGAAIAAISIAKLHPASLLLWIAARAWAERGGPQGRVLAAATVTGVSILAASLLVGGIQPWLDYVQVIQVGAGADLVDPRNYGPVSLLGQATGLDAASLRIAQVVVTLTAFAVTAIAALRIRDPLTSLAVAFTASLVTLPVTWYHYPVALIPVALTLAILHPAARPRVVFAMVIAALAIAIVPLLWVAVAVLLIACLRPDAPLVQRATATDPRV
jgi:hypothetical protein